MSYLFLAVPPFSGSTVLYKHIIKCEAVRTLNAGNYNCWGEPLNEDIEGDRVIYREGHYNMAGKFPVIQTPGYYKDVLDAPENYDWPLIKKLWDDNWDTSPKSNSTIRVQKTPNDVYRLKIIHPYFDDLKWIISVRNPYAYGESLIEKLLNFRRDPVEHVDKILYHITNTYEIQKENQEFLGNNAYSMTYEDFVFNSKKHEDGIKNFMPELHDLNFDSNVIVKNQEYDKLYDNNDERIEKLKNIPGAIDRFNEHFYKHREIINYWGYELI